MGVKVTDECCVTSQGVSHKHKVWGVPGFLTDLSVANIMGAH